MGVTENRMALAKIDAARVRKLGQMLVTGGDKFHEPRQVLYDLAGKDAAEILSEYLKSREGYATTPFDPNGEKFRFFRKGYTIWSGYPGAGKTTALRHLICHLLGAGQKVFVASMEEDPVQVIVQTAGSCFGCEVPTVDQLQWFMDFYRDDLKIWGVIGKSLSQEIMGTAQMLAKEHGVTQVFIDSLMCLDVNSQDFEGQRLFANNLGAVAIESNIHIHLVAHPRKAVSVEQEPDINDVAGGADYGRLAHNVVFVRKGKVESFSGVPECTPMQFAIRKQRYGTGFTGEITGWLNRRLRQYKADQFDQKPTQYLPKQAYEETVSDVTALCRGKWEAK